jgi:filamentous hemagglutinin family protein
MLHISACLVQAATPITPSGLDTQVNISTAQTSGQVQYDITGGARAGTNLFHSFGEFDVPHNNIANFLNDTGLVTTNILGRVTGGNVSNIFGTIQTTGFGNANLFLMNPAGIVFGHNASLNVGGSVAFTTADYLRLEKVGGSNAGIFHADPARVSLLTSAPVDAFGFLGSNAAAITVQGSQLTVSEGHGISLIGGNITIQDGILENGTAKPARLSAQDGQINLATTKSAGEFLANLPFKPTSEPTGPSIPNINGASFTSFGSAHVASGSMVDVSQTGNGKVSIRGGQLVLEIQNSVLDTANDSASTANSSGKDAIVFAPESSIISQTFSADHGPNVRIGADQITILGVPASKENFFMKPFTGMGSDTYGTGKAGDIILRATEDINTTGVVNLDSLTFARGDSGSIELTSTHGNIRMIRGGTEAQGSSQAMAMSSGNAGNLTASALKGDIELDGTSLFTLTNGSGKTGEVKVEAINLRMKAGLLSSLSIGPGEDKPGSTSVILSGNLTMTSDSSLVLPDGFLTISDIFTASLNKSPAADITIKAKDIVVIQKSIINSAAFASGPGGNITIVADTLQVTDGAQLSSGSTKAPNRGQFLEILGGASPTGHGGNITIQTLGPKGSVLIDGKGSGILATTEGSGAGGTINLSAKTLTIQNGGTLSAETIGTSARATGGSIIVNAGDEVVLNSSALITASTSGAGNAGNISLRVNEITVNGSATVTASSTGTGKAGAITINGMQGPANSILVDGLKSGIFSDTTKTGAGGNIDLTASSVTLQNGGAISAATSGTASSSTGGSIIVNATDQVTLTDGASITASSTGPGDAGNISINAGQRFDIQDSSVTTEAKLARGGNIDIKAVDLIRVANGEISTSVRGGAGSGGNITIDPKVVVLQNSQIFAQAVRGKGGDITIRTPVFLADSFSDIDASAPFGLNGTVTIQSPNAPASGKIQPLNNRPLEIAALLNQSCAAVAGGQFSSFTVAGRDSLPLEPGGWLSSPLASTIPLPHDTHDESAIDVGSRLKRAEQMRERPLLSLRRIAPPGFLTRAFAAPSSAGCVS